MYVSKTLPTFVHKLSVGQHERKSWDVHSFDFFRFWEASIFPRGLNFRQLLVFAKENFYDLVPSQNTVHVNHKMEGKYFSRWRTFNDWLEMQILKGKLLASFLGYIQQSRLACTYRLTPILRFQLMWHDAHTYVSTYIMALFSFQLQVHLYICIYACIWT
jgi:hypothetical protein